MVEIDKTGGEPSHERMRESLLRAWTLLFDSEPGDDVRQMIASISWVINTPEDAVLFANVVANAANNFVDYSRVPEKAIVSSEIGPWDVAETIWASEKAFGENGESAFVARAMDGDRKPWAFYFTHDGVLTEIVYMGENIELTREKPELRAALAVAEIAWADQARSATRRTFPALTEKWTEKA